MQFKLEFEFLSNFYDSPIKYKDLKFKTVEHAYQSSKTRDANWKSRIIEASTPGKAKRLGRDCPAREDWEEVKVKCMKYFVRKKFKQNPELLDKLKSIKGPIVEHNYWHDNFWGHCLCMNCSGKQIGNQLGKILMEIRDEI